MAIITPAQQLVQDITCGQGKPSNLEGRISGPGGVTPFGAFVQGLQPGTRSSIRHRPLRRPTRAPGYRQ